jgi:hypothetical protein
MVDLVKRYLDNVKSLLPRDRRDDIAEELADAIHSRLDERSAELGRALTPAEIEAVLRGFGHPVMVAARYGPQGRLIGPELYPLWVWSVKLLIFITVVSGVGRMVAALVQDPEPSRAFLHVQQVWSHWLTGALATVGLATVIFALMERFKFNPLDRWRLKDLPEPIRFGPRPADPVGQWIALPFNLAFLLVWAGLPFAHDRLPEAWDPFHWLDLLGLSLAPVWGVLWALALVSAAIELGLNLHRIAAPQALRAHLVWRMAASGVALVSTAVLLAAQRLFETASGAPIAGVVAATVRDWGPYWRLGAILVGAIALANLVWRGVQLARLRRSSRRVA